MYVVVAAFKAIVLFQMSMKMSKILSHQHKLISTFFVANKVPIQEKRSSWSMKMD